MKVLVFCLGMIVASASEAASAVSLNIAWNACSRDGGVALRTSACNSNLDSGANANNVELSIVPDADMPGFVGIVGFVHVYTSGPVPGWWGYGCAAKLPAATFRFSGENLACSEGAYYLTGSPPYSGISPVQYLGYGANTIEVVCWAANPQGYELDLVANTEYFVGRLTVSNVATTGAGACPGCSTPACILFYRAHVDRVGFPFPFVFLGGYSSWVAWQGWGSTCSWTPARNQTWGAIKSLYR